MKTNMKNILFVTIFFLGMFLSANAQNYWIEGLYERLGEGRYTLKDVRTNGIYLNGQTRLTEQLSGEKRKITCDGVDANMVKFTFNMATTDCPTKWSKGFTFQYWDEDNNKWKTDVEACRSSNADYSQKDVVIMLVLDYSSSMADNISSLQTSAIKFINGLSSASNGNIHVGIIAFSGMELAKKQVFPITPLNRDNNYQFEQFIRNSSKGKETALYYSMDNAIKMIDEYVLNKGITYDKFNGAFMITFTDGMDNASINDAISVSMHRGRKNEYLNYLSGKLSGPSRKTILGQPIENFAIGFTGSEEFGDDEIAFFRDVLQQTTPDEGHFKLATQFKEVESFFEYIVSNLTKRWENLNMFIGESNPGKIRWVLECGETPKQEPVYTPTPTPTPTKRVNFTHGIELGGIFGSDYTDLFGGFELGYDFGVKIGNHCVGINVGLNYSLGTHTEVTEYHGYYGSYWQDYNEYTYTAIGFSMIPHYMHYNNYGNAFIVGAGYTMLYDEFAGVFRLGFKTMGRFYMTFDLIAGGVIAGKVNFGIMLTR